MKNFDSNDISKNFKIAKRDFSTNS